MLTISNPQSETILEKLNSIHEKCKKDRDISEDKLKSYFHKSGILEELGYKDEDIHIEETVKAQKRTDIHVTDEYGNVKAVIEFKKPTVSNLRDHFEQLWERYVIPLKAEYGLLYNGFEMYFYERIKKESDKIFGLNISDLKGEHTSKIIYHIEKPKYDLTQIKEVSKYLKKFEDPEEKLNLKDEASREHFFESFKLKRDSAFGKMVKASIRLFNSMEDKEEYNFLRSAYDFWKTSYAKKPDKVPKNWKPIMEECGLSNSQRDLYKFMFCLETTYALFTRLILAKSAEDYNFADVKFVGFLENKIADASRRGDIPRASWGKMTQELIRDMKNTLVSSVFEEDIFYWWTGPFEEQTYNEMYFTSNVDDVTYASDNFGDGIRDILLTFCKFDFSEIKGDPLGILYQRYFDKETRKALGEFYTPQKVVDYILDSVDYKGRKVLEKRLLDPACGSGTFLVTALQRYLEASQKKAEEKGWDTVLDNLCNKYRIVGFDIHPFATIMAQIQFMLVLLPYYKQAVEDNKKFVLRRVPIFRTDSLKDESKGGKISLQDFENGKRISMNIKLPVQEEEGGFFEENFSMPHSGTVLRNTDIYNNEEYFGALQGLFDVVKTQAKRMEAKNKIIEFDTKRYEKVLRNHYLSDKNWSRISSFFKSFGDELMEKINRLQSEFDDGRLIKSIEDIFLASLLKNEQRYDFVVGNPPYVRIDYLPDKDKKEIREHYNEYLKGKWDLYMPFLLRGGWWLNSNGHVGFICSNKFFLNESAENLREEVLKYNWKEIIDLSGVEVFEGALPAPAIIIFSNQSPTQKIKMDVKRTSDLPQRIIESQKRDIDKLENAVNYLLENISFYEVSQNRYDEDEEKLFSIYPENISSIIEKIKEDSKQFIKLCNDGISEGDTKRKEEKNVLSEEEYKHLESSEKKNYRKVIRGGDVQKYYASWKTSKRDYILNLRSPENNRILIKDMSPEMITAPEYAKYRCLRTIYCATLEEKYSNSVKEIVGQLNSKLSNFYYICYFYTSQMSPRKGNYRFREQFVKRMPIIPIENEKFENLVNKIEQKIGLEEKIDRFPEEFVKGGELSRKILSCDSSHSNMEPNIQQTQDGMFRVVVGKRKKEEPILVDTKEKAKFVKNALKGDSVRKGEKIEILVPKSNQTVKDILDEYRVDKQKLNEMSSLEEVEEEINQIVYDLYGLDSKDIEVIENFLEKF